MEMAVEQETPWSDLRKILWGKMVPRDGERPEAPPHAPDTDSQPRWLPWICVIAKASPRQ